MEEPFAVVWSLAAQADFDDIVDYLAAKDLSAAERMAADIVLHVETLRSFPFIGPVFPGGDRRKYRRILCGKYHLVYCANEEERRVEIVSIWHGSRESAPPR